MSIYDQYINLKNSRKNIKVSCRKKCQSVQQEQEESNTYTLMLAAKEAQVRNGKFFVEPERGKRRHKYELRLVGGKLNELGQRQGRERERERERESPFCSAFASHRREHEI